ncbi:TonB-dependent receptor plug domain-containing protein [Chryseobacterium sp. LC2016-29]|uniref:TonB-dependent receptor plug domain-containing protein n=1 Tax=Chryseobacterium sp. LC2016-29 TaxID=2897331 RepID=UPI001E2BEA08|nr:TonB-dependent receptor plug domain-containing protein [Chryseobacterium sp. LC2016-29]MCD0480477.1 TonB-dependent receptor plug domain-containing protein [Chryseobacterium sp. LC2016-29]
MKIILPKPCQENWETMSPQEKGRFCAVCSKTVRDFTNDSDDEILDYFSEHSSQNICGNFYESQLNRNMQYSFINSLFSKFAIAFILTAGGIVSVDAQENDSVKISVLANLQGEMIGLSATSENTTFRPSTRGMPSSIQVNNEPLWVVDRIVVDAKTVKDLDPKKIKSMKVIKGAGATAIYGSKASNGVVIITTKREGRKKK